MPVPPAELSATFTVTEEAAHAAGRAAAAPSGLARDAGPHDTLISGARADVLAALDAAIEAALDAGARRVDVRLEAPTEARGA